MIIYSDSNFFNLEKRENMRICSCDSIVDALHKQSTFPDEICQLESEGLVFDSSMWFENMPLLPDNMVLLRNNGMLFYDKGMLSS